MLLRDEAIALVTEYGKGAAWTKHCFAVADSAAKVGLALDNRVAINHRFLWSAALLHDIGRYATHDPIRHGVKGYELLMKLGHEEEALVCASHILFGLEAVEAVQFGLPARDFLPGAIEERLVPLVDFMTEGIKTTTLDRRFSSLRKRNTGNDFFLNRLDRAREAAESFLRQLDELIGFPVEKIITS